MIPERYAAKVSRLGELAARNEGSDVGDLALELASFVAEAAQNGELPDDALASRVATLAQKVDARLVVHELAIAELARRFPEPDEEAQATVFKIPVVLAEGVDGKRIRAAIDELPEGLESDEVVDRLEELGLLHRVKEART